MSEPDCLLPLVADVVEAWAPTGGGIRSYIEAKAAHWTRTGRARHVLIVPGSRDHVRHEGLRTVVEIRGPRIPGCAPYRFLLNQDRLLETLRAFRPDVVELGSQYLAPTTVLAYREGSGALVSGFFHTDLAGAYVGPVARRFFGRRVAASLEARTRHRFVELGRRLDLTLASSPRHLEALAALGVPRLHPLPLGVDLEVFRPDAARFTMADPRDPPATRESVAPCRFVFVGRLDREKRVPLLLEAFRRAGAGTGVPRLLLVGDGPLAPEVRAAVAASGGRIAHHPFETDRRRLARLLASCDVYVTAGPFETFGLAVLEGQACGLPVLGVRAGALLDRVAEGTGWLVPPDDPDALASAIRDVSRLPRSTRKRAGAAARDLAVRDGGWAEPLSALARHYGLPAPGAALGAALGAAFGAAFGSDTGPAGDFEASARSEMTPIP